MCGICDQQQRQDDEAARTFEDAMAQLSAALGGAYADGHYSDVEMVLEAIRRLEAV